jgi:hypothetical protein
VTFTLASGLRRTDAVLKVCARRGSAFFVFLTASCAALTASAQDQSRSTQHPLFARPLVPLSAPTDTAQKVGDSAPSTDAKADRIFGVLPNYTTVEERTKAPAITTRMSFEMAAMNSFDPYVFPIVGIMAGLGQGEGHHPYGDRYAVALADNSLGNFLTTAIVPSVVGQDPRYFELGEGGFFRRFAYAASRSVVTRSRSGQTQFNISEIGGNAMAAGLSNLYYGSVDRSLAATMTRWGSQVMWDTVANEMKEFWPDIRRKLHHR